MNKSKLGFIDFYKELDQQEIKLKEEYDKMVSTPITALSALLAGAYFVITKISPYVILWDNFSYVTVGAFSVFFLIWALSAFYFTDFIHFYRGYRVFPKAFELNEYQDQLIEYLEAAETDSKREAEFEQSFQNYILQTYIEQATHNASINEKRNKSYFLYKRYLIICFYLLVIISIVCLIKILFL